MPLLHATQQIPRQGNHFFGTTNFCQLNRDGETNQFSTRIVVSTLEVSNLFGVFDRGARVEQMVCQKYLKFLQQMKAFDYKH